MNIFYKNILYQKLNEKEKIFIQFNPWQSTFQYEFYLLFKKMNFLLLLISITV